MCNVKTLKVFRKKKDVSYLNSPLFTLRTTGPRFPVIFSHLRGLAPAVFCCKSFNMQEAVVPRPEDISLGTGTLMLIRLPFVNIRSRRLSLSVPD